MVFIARASVWFPSSGCFYWFTGRFSGDPYLRVYIYQMLSERKIGSVLQGEFVQIHMVPIQ